MAIATATISPFAYPKGYDNTQRNTIVRGTIAISTGGTYPPGGFPLNWGGIEGIKSVPPASLTPSSTGNIFPIDMDVKSVANPPSGYVYLWDNVLGNLHIFVVDHLSTSNSSGPLYELGGAIDNAIVTDTIEFTAVFTRE
jgi:hypothetical protein